MSAWEDVLLDSGDQRKPADWWWAYVTDTDPLRIRRELETHPIGSTPSTLVAGLEVGDKVRVVNYLGQALIVGSAGGSRGISDGANTLRIGDDGRPFVQSQAIFDRDYDVTPNVYVTPIGTLGRATIPTPRTAQGVVALSGTANQVVTSTVTFPAGRFTGAPSVSANVRTGAPQNRSVTAGSESATNFTIYAWSSASATLSVSWQAMQV